MMGWEGTLQWAVLALYGAFLLWRGFGPVVGFATWHMFARVSLCHFELEIAGPERRPFNPWDYMPHTQLVMSRDNLELFLFYLSKVHHLRLEGVVHVREGQRLETLRVKDTRVVD